MDLAETARVPQSANTSPTLLRKSHTGLVCYSFNRQLQKCKLFRKEFVNNRKSEPDLQHINFDRDGCVHLALHRKETQKKLWESMQQFKDIKPARKKS